MKKFLLLLIIFPTLLLSQTQISSDINGENAEDQSGHDVSISHNGNVIAIGARYNSDNGNQSGHVRVYENIGGVWTQIGLDINGEAAEDESGTAVSLSFDGTIVAIGAQTNDGNGLNSGHVRVYENIGGVWTQIGSDINGEAAGDSFGYSVSLSLDGSILAIGGATNNGNGSNSGHVRVYENIGGIWTQIGSDIDGEAAEDFSGTDVSLSSDGSIVAIGAYSNDGNGSNSGHVRVYENIGGVWTQIGSDINGEAAEDRFGENISLSSDGKIVAIGAYYNDGNGSNSGHVRVYENVGGIWTQIGLDIDGEAAGDQFGSNISLSSNGKIVAIGGIFNNDGGSLAGHVRVYENIGGTWTQVGSDIDGQTSLDLVSNVSISSDGTKLIIGARNSSYNGTRSGHASVYDLSSVLSIESFELDYFTIYPNPTKNFINIELNQGIEQKNINIYNALGQFVLSTNDLKINTSKLNSGVYFIEIETNKGKSAKKLIIE